MDITGEKEKRTSKKNVDGRSTSSNDNKKFRTRSVEKQRGTAFGFRKTATAVKKPGRQIENHVFECLWLVNTAETRSCIDKTNTDFLCLTETLLTSFNRF